MERDKIVIPKVWRSELLRLILFVVLSAASVIASHKLPGSIISGHLFTIGQMRFELSLPLFWLLPLMALGSAFFRIYNVRYSVDSRGIESRIGILALNQVITRIRFEDIRSIETGQTLIERLLDIGMVEMGTAASGGMEMVFEGVNAPREVQRLIQNERDARMNALQAAAARPREQSLETQARAL